MVDASFDVQLEIRYCPMCCLEQRTETPPCTDGHGEHCPERVCAVCATAIFVNPVLVDRVLMLDLTARVISRSTASISDFHAA
jgi:hypothetical protein